jgi:hypothetical protein
MDGKRKNVGKKAQTGPGEVAASAAEVLAAAPWRNRIVGYGEEAPDQLLANAKNWRIHPQHQQKALSETLRTVGIVQNVLVNKRSGFVVDGHLRAAMGISEGQPTIPVTYVDLSEQEEAAVLATLDPLSAMAAKDEEIFKDLTAGMDDAYKSLAEMTQPVSQWAEPAAEDQSAAIRECFQVIVDCKGESSQTQLLERLSSEGYECRALIS